VTGLSASAMEGLSGFDRSMTKRLESSAMAFYELKHQEQQGDEQCREMDCSAADDPAAGRMRSMGVVHHQRPTSDTPLSTSSSSSSSGASRGCVRQLPLHRGPHDDDVRLTTTDTDWTALDRSPRSPTAEAPIGGAMITACGTGSNISFSISRILGHVTTSATPVVASSRRGSAELARHPAAAAAAAAGARSKTDGRAGYRRSQSPDSSCRVAGDDVDVRHGDVGNDVDHDVIDDDDDDDVMVKLRGRSPSSAITPGAAAAAASVGSLHRLSWLQCTRYKPPKLPSENRLYLQLYLLPSHGGMRKIY